MSFDPDKNERNLRERALPPERAAEFDFETAKLYQDRRNDYPEVRIVAIGYLDHRLHVLVFCETLTGIRVISFRKANAREGARHGFPLARD
ncbi:MAG: BrnT family toxin [Synergistaceae bacterium]|nr:BrnT family toxin [Synergistaceae bacterium]